MSLRFYTTERLGKTRELTPEGFLVCHDVPIARTGTMFYAAGEVPVEPGPDGIIRIERTADEVFRPETLASFAGKAVVNDHPAEDVSPKNWRSLAVGHVQNVRRGEGVLDDLMLGDLLITDEDAIKAILEEDKLEVSCGYEADYEQLEPGRGVQRNILGNHVALVDKGRCGPRCSIGDKETTMPILTKKFRDRIRKAFHSNDSDELEKAMAEAGDDTSSSESAGGGGIEHHVHVNIGGPSNSEKAEEDDPDKAATGDKKSRDEEGNSIEEKILSLLERIDSKLDGKTEDADKEDKKDDEERAEDEDPDDKKDDDKKSEDRRTKDSAGLANEFQETVSRAEILVPGIRVPTFDKKMDPKKTADSLCALRRKALEIAYNTTDSKAHVEPFVTGKSADFSKMTCDAVSMIFNGAAELARRGSKASGSNGFSRDHDSAGVPTPAMINQKNRDFWAKH